MLSKFSSAVGVTILATDHGGTTLEKAFGGKALSWGPSIYLAPGPTLL